MLITLSCSLNFANAQVHIPEPIPPPPAIRSSFDLDPFYQQWIDVEGFPVIASAKVSPYAVKEVAYLIRQIIRHNPAALEAMVQNKVRFSIIGHNERTTDIPEHRIHPEPHFFYDVRNRGGYCPRCLTVSAPEETVLDEGWYSVTIHEFAHAFHEAGLNTIDPTFDNRLRTTYNMARARGLWQNTYAGTNMSEYWAQGVGTWFNANPGFQSATTREALKNYDPGLASLLTEIFGDGDWQYTLPATRTHSPHLRGFDPREAPKLKHPSELLETYREFTNNPGNDGGGKWMNLESYPPSQLQSLNRSRTIGDSTTSVYFMNHTGATVQVYRVNFDGEEMHARNVIPGNFTEFTMNIGDILLVKDDTGKKIAVFLVEKKIRGSIVRIFVGNPKSVPTPGTEIAEKPPVKAPTTGTYFAVAKPSKLAQNNFTIGPGEFAILVHNGRYAGVKQADFKTYDAYRGLGNNSRDIPNLAQSFQNGGRIELISHATVNPLPRGSSEAQFGDIVISEIMWGLDGISPAKQYIELYNASAHTYSFANANVSLRFSTVPQKPLPNEAFAPPFNPNTRVKVIDRVNNKGWKVPGKSGNISQNKRLISMYRTIDYTTGSVPDGTLASSWKASRGRVNLSVPSYGTPGAIHLPPAPVVLGAASQRPPMYWIDTEAGTFHRLIGNEVKDLLPNVQNATNLAVDTTNNKIYWTEQTGKNRGRIRGANLDGSNLQILATSLSVPTSIALDPAKGKLYWTNTSGRLKRVNVNGKQNQALIKNLNAPNNITLDIAGDKLYWIEASGRIRRANLNGKSIQNIARDLDPISGIAIAGNKIYWTETTASGGGKIRGANLNGSNANTLAKLQHASLSIAIDPVGNKLYWTEANGRIRRANLNGKQIQNVVSGLVAPAALVLSGVGSGPAAPSNILLASSQTTIRDATRLLANYPNPFNPETWIPYQLAKASNVKITIYDARGVVVRRIELGHQPPGTYTSQSRAAYWDGRNSQGERVANGIYFYQLQADNISSLGKMLILK